MTIEEVVKNPDLLKQKETIDFISKLPIFDIVKLFHHLNDQNKLDIFQNLDIKNININTFNSIFLQSSVNVQKEILKNEKIFDKVMKIPETRLKKSILEIIDDETLYCILNNPLSIKYYQEIDAFINKVNNEMYKKIRDNTKILDIYINNQFHDLNELEQHLNQIYNNKEIVQEFLIKCKSKILNPLDTIRIKNEKEFIIYVKFNVLINVDINQENYILSDNTFLDENYILNVNERQVNKLLESLKVKANQSDQELLVASLKLYQIFGFDNAMKIINDKFTYLTASSNIRIAETNFRDDRREFRLNHQEKFYHYGLENEILNALKNKNFAFFEQFCFTRDRWYITDFISFIALKINKLESQERMEAIKEIAISEINQRENYYKDKYIKRYIEKLNAKERPSELTASEICKIFGNVNIPYKLDESGRILPNQQLNEFLLGNFKKDNDCLLRIIFNKEGLGLNNTISDIINKFDMFKSIVDKSNGNLSLNSILDVIDISKIKLYNLAPNEQDITLDTLSKIIKSKIYCSENEALLLKRTTELHVKRKEKIYSSIPIVDDNIDNVKYETIPFDADYALTLGIEVGNCFKVGGKGEDLLSYCLLSPHAIILSLKDEDNNKYICPFIRTGNTIHGNGIDPIPNEKYIPKLLKALETFSKEICLKSGIDIVTITDLHIFDYMKNSNYKECNITNKIPIDADLYSDYHKNEIKNYILYKISDDVESNYYLPDEKFYQKRNLNYQYSVTKEYDKERIQLIINSIAYSSIDYESNPDKEKNKMKRKFKNLDINNYQYIIGNKDWFIAIDSNLNIISYLLPYDERARTEYLEAFAKLSIMDNHLMEENNGIRR